MSTNTLGRYHIIRELARSNDIVYEAMDPAQGKKIALKELQIPANLVGAQRQERIARFTREARSAAGLKHTNIVRILDHGQSQGRYYIAMEFLQGQSLRDVLRQRGALPPQEAFRIAAAVADGLDYAHAHGVVHRDIKPDNVHLEPDGRVVITDFGIARLTFEPTLTAAGQIFGTPSYMSPEQIAGKGIDHRTDLFSLGVMLYEMIAGRKPFTGDSVITITYNIMNMEAPVLPGAPVGVDGIVRRAMAKETGRRYSKASEMAEDIRAVASGGRAKHAERMPPPSVPTPSAPAPGNNGGGYGRAAQPPSRPMPAPAPPAPRGGYAAPPLPSPAPYRPSAPPPPSAGARLPGMPPPGVRPGARPMSANGMARPAPSAGGGYAPPVAVPPQPVFHTPASVRNRREGGTDLGWLLGWLGLAVVIGLMILGLVWVSVNAYDRFRADTALATAEKTHLAAATAFKQGKYEEALKGYLEAARFSRGERQLVAKKNAAYAAVALGEKWLKEGDAAKAEQYALQGRELNEDFPAAYVLLGRAQGKGGKVDEAVQTLDLAVDAARRAQAGATKDEAAQNQKVVDTVPLWKADALYQDGLAQMAKNKDAARQRFEMVLKVAPNSDYARNARTYLQQLQAASGVPVDAGMQGVPELVAPDLSQLRGSSPGFPDAGLPGPGSNPPTQPEGWQSNYGINARP